MELHRHNASLTSSERKRLRDRKAQRTMKEKRENRVRILEERVAFCERHHGGGWTHHVNPHSLNETESLHWENEMLRSRLESLRKMFDSWGRSDGFEPRERQKEASRVLSCNNRGPTIAGTTDTPSGPPRFAEEYGTHESQLDNIIPGSAPNAAISTTPEGPGIAHLPAVHHLTQALPSAVPSWFLVPMNDYGHLPQTVQALCSWISRPDLIIACAPQPSPLALLYGTRRNWLANEIHRATRQRAIQDPECLAVGWLMYNFSKWRVSPNPATFARLATFQRPILAQLQHGHPVGIDLLPWPQLRLNIILNWRKYDYVELTGYLSCCMKVRWPWGEEILARDEDDNLQIRQKFVDVFTQESGWGLTPEFISKYPELLEGMDVEAVRFQVALENCP